MTTLRTDGIAIKRPGSLTRPILDELAENLLRFLGRPHGLALDSWMRGKFSRTYHGGRPVTDRTIHRAYARCGPWAGLAVWFDLLWELPANSRILSLGFAVAVAVWTLGEMLSLPLTNAVAGHRAPPGQSGAYMGAYTLAFSAAFVLGPTTGTAVFQAFGGEAHARQHRQQCGHDHLAERGLGHDIDA